MGTIDDILREMRDKALELEHALYAARPNHTSGRELRCFADRIEAAQKNDPFVRHKAAIIDALMALLGGCNPCGETMVEVEEFLKEVNYGND